MRTLLFSGLLLACAHAQQTEDSSRVPEPTSEAGEADRNGDPEARADEKNDSDDPAHQPAEAAQQPGKGGPKQKEGRVAGGSEDPDEIPVASSPSGLLKPGAEQKVREKLGVEAGGSLRPALQKFQKEHDLPATGMLDQRTTEALGLDPDDLFERASGS